jgi:hypothetical protein
MCSLYPPLLSVLFSERAHPSDSRMATWGPVTYTVVRFALFLLMFHALFLTADLLASDYQGTSSPSAFPMAQFKNANNPTTIYFNVTAAELGARTLEIGTTSSFAGGRPQATINSFSGPNPTAPTEETTKSTRCLSPPARSSKAETKSSSTLSAGRLEMPSSLPTSSTTSFVFTSVLHLLHRTHSCIFARSFLFS